MIWFWAAEFRMAVCCSQFFSRRIGIFKNQTMTAVKKTCPYDTTLCCLMWWTMNLWLVLLLAYYQPIYHILHSLLCVSAWSAVGVLSVSTFLKTNISQGGAATSFRCDGICNDRFIANFLLSVSVKEFWKSVSIWQRYGQEFGVLFLWLTVYLLYPSRMVKYTDNIYEYIMRHDSCVTHSKWSLYLSTENCVILQLKLHRCAHVFIIFLKFVHCTCTLENVG